MTSRTISDDRTRAAFIALLREMQMLATVLPPWMLVGISQRLESVVVSMRRSAGIEVDEHSEDVMREKIRSSSRPPLPKQAMTWGRWLQLVVKGGE